MRLSLKLSKVQKHDAFFVNSYNMIKFKRKEIFETYTYGLEILNVQLVVVDDCIL
jgi:imidazoleglycerol phosphate synthase glutamine amidotransferase subunit HisH